MPAVNKRKRAWSSSEGAALPRVLSKLGFASRKDARALIAAGRVRVDGALVTDPARRIAFHAKVTVDDVAAAPRPRRVIAFNKPRGTVTTRRDPQGRRTVFDVLGATSDGLIAVGRLDAASTGLLLLTNDTQLANALTDPANQVPRTYVVTVRGRVDEAIARRIETGIAVPATSHKRELLQASRVTIRKASGRESHLIVELMEGRNREIRRLFAAEGHEVTRLHRIAFGPYRLEHLQPGEWREVT
jgi:23S rRNA pseudouridine2605 synthase